MPFKFVKVPKDFECSITHEIMVDPVFTADGDTYEREAIKEWLKNHDTNPNTNEKLEHKSLVPNKKLKSQIAEFVEQNRKSFEQELIEAVKQGDNETLQLVLKLGIGINTQDENGWAALHHAAFNNQRVTLEYLIKNHAITDLKTAALLSNYHVVFYQNKEKLLKEDIIKEYKTHQDYLSKVGNLRFYKKLKPETFPKGDEFKKYVDAVLLHNEYYPTPSFCIQKAVQDPVEYEKLELASSMMYEIQKYAEVGGRGNIGKSKKYKVNQSEVQKVREVIWEKIKSLKNSMNEKYDRDRWYTYINEQNKSKEQTEKEEDAEHYKASFEAAYKLFDLYNEGFPKEMPLITPLQLAAYKGYLGIIDTLIQFGSTLAAQDTWGWTALHWAVSNNQVDAVKYLLQKEIDYQVKDKNQLSALDLASELGHKEVQELIKAEINKKEEEQALFHASQQKKISMLEQKIVTLESTIEHLTNILQKALPPEFAQQLTYFSKEPTIISNNNNASNLSGYNNITFIGQLDQQTNSAMSRSSANVNDDIPVKNQDLQRKLSQ